MDPTGVVGLDRGHSAECHAGFRLSPEGMVYSIGRLDIEMTMDASLLGPLAIRFGRRLKPASTYECTAFCNGPGDVKFPRVIVTPPSSRFCPWSAPRPPHYAVRRNGEPI